MTDNVAQGMRGSGSGSADAAAEGKHAGIQKPGHSETALTAAAARAAHLIVDSEPLIFADPLAAVILGDQADELIGYHREHGSHPVLAGARGQVTVRSRYAEDCLASAARRGIRQYVILGAGLDSFGYRGGLARRIRVFEVDHPATQDWKRERLARAGVGVPDTVSYIPADLEAGSLADRLAAGGFDLSEPALVSWLGVIMYLTAEAVGQSLAAIASLAPGTELVADYLLPAGLRDAAGENYAELVAPVAAQRGEPWLTTLSPDDMAGLLIRHGFAVAGQPGQAEALDPRMWLRSDALRPVRLQNLAWAVVSDRTRA